MRMTIRLILLIAVLSLSACAIKPITEDGLRSTAVVEDSFSVNRAYQEVFKDLLENTRNCFSRQATQDQLYVSGEKVIADKTATIRVVYLYGNNEKNVHFLIDLEADDTEKTTVKTYSADSGLESSVKAVKLWANKKNKQCKA